MHRDVKPENILLNYPSELTGSVWARAHPGAMLVDFGVARLNPELETALTERPGTESYQAPELASSTYSYDVDVFALGCVLARVLGLREGSQQLKEPGDPNKLRFHPEADNFLSGLTRSLLSLNPLDRPTMPEVMRMCLVEIARRELRVLNHPRGKDVDPSDTAGLVFSRLSPEPTPFPLTLVTEPIVLSAHVHQEGTLPGVRKRLGRR